MKFRNKILLAIWSVVLGLVVVTFLIINYRMRSQTEEKAAEELLSNYSTIGELNTLQCVEVSNSCQILAESPRLKAVVELGDRNTAVQLSRDLIRNTPTDLFLLTNARGEPLVQLMNGEATKFTIAGLGVDSVIASKIMAVRVWGEGGTVYRCATSPVIIGNDLVGTMAIGFRITPAEIERLHSMTNSDIYLLLDRAPVIASSPADERQVIEDWIRTNIARYEVPPQDPALVIKLVAASGQYEAVICNLNAGRAVQVPRVSYVLLRSIDREVQFALRPVIESFIVLSAIVLVVTAVIGFFISTGITRPIAELIRGTGEVSRGNYDFRINVGGGGEMAFLALKFEEMSRALKDKVNQLATQNAELERALRRLKETQDELVRTERLAATGKMTAQLSHEINNPVHNIQSCLQTVLKRMPGTSPERELLDVAYEEVERLARLTRQLLQVYRTSMVPESLVPVCLNDIIKEVLSLSAESLREGNIRVTTALDDRLPPILGSPDKLKQVFLNLVLNAKDAMPHGGTVSASTARDNGSVIVTVADTGVGIPQENIHRIFDAFFTTKSKVSGVGLGLAVTYGIIRQHDGTIAVKSEPGNGTLFTMSFPATT